MSFNHRNTNELMEVVDEIPDNYNRLYHLELTGSTGIIYPSPLRLRCKQVINRYVLSNLEYTTIIHLKKHNIVYLVNNLAKLH